MAFPTHLYTIMALGSITDGMKWKITVTDSGAYRLTPKNGEFYDYALATSSSNATNGARLMQGEYWDNNSYCDEWLIEEFEKKAIFIIPGMLGSELKDENGEEVWVSGSPRKEMKLNEDGTPKHNLESFNDDNYGARNTYKSLYNYLYKKFKDRYHVVFFDYDFRLSNAVSAQKLEQETAGFDKVILVAHSMGGLVAAKYLSNSETNRTKTEAFIAIGSPFLGSAKTINVMETGEMLTFWGMDVYKKMIKEVAKNSYPISVHRCKQINLLVNRLLKKLQPMKRDG